MLPLIKCSYSFGSVGAVRAELHVPLRGTAWKGFAVFPGCSITVLCVGLKTEKKELGAALPGCSQLRQLLCLSILKKRI